MREEILTARQHGLLRRMAPIATASGWYLAGGTAIALHLGHRRSDDFDWFTDGTPLDAEPVAAHLRATIGFVAETLDQGTVIGTADGVRLSCFEYKYPLLEPLEIVADWSLRMASLRDLAAMKVLAVTQRGSRKDFIDVDALLDHGIALDTMLGAYQQKLGIASRMSALRGLVYFDDAEEEPVPEMLKDLNWTSLKDRIRRAVDQVLR